MYNLNLSKNKTETLFEDIKFSPAEEAERGLTEDEIEELLNESLLKTYAREHSHVR